mmetsp:Transcript_6897/g.23470  ORF Transcript_6897/g.23470 Transcript_6897/m.23470 type:complete len:101 (-) Transcript_6897:1162-1464(-)
MKLKRFLLRYYPPGVILEYELRDKSRETKEIDLLHLSPEYVKLCVLKSPSASRTDVEVLVNQVTFEEPLISDNRKPQLRRLIYSTKIRLCPDNFTNLSQN